MVRGTSFKSPLKSNWLKDHRKIAHVGITFPNNSNDYTFVFKNTTSYLLRSAKITDTF